MLIREYTEKQEHDIFRACASFSDESKGRDVQEEKCDIRTDFQRDRDRIIHCKAFRRMKHKTQVFLAPGGDHYRTRLTHTLEVAQISRTIARALRLNEDLTEAIALGHDLGHTPFGHAGERMLDKCCSKRFHHNEQSVRVVEKLEKNGKGLNLTKEVRDGIWHHRSSGTPATLEGKIVKFSDQIAYVNHDIDDGIRAGILSEEILPAKCTNLLGHSTRDRINTIIHEIVNASENTEDVVFPEEYFRCFQELRSFMFANLYTNSLAKGEEKKAELVVEMLFNEYMQHSEKLPQEYYRYIVEGIEEKETVVCDYIAGMTDNFAVAKAKELFLPRFWEN